MEQEGRDLRDLAMEDWTESTRWEEFIEELMVIDEAGGSQGQGVYEGMLDTENLTHSRTVEGIELIDQGTDVSDGGVQNLTDNFTGSVSIVTDESRVSEGLYAHKAKGEALLTTKLA
ncbi:hypothetical protein D5086_003504 [Populus alba]|uniref:Uncharacterized protein n=1 Tax=Populus alba TaxID=43335 RepID=A0ACC4D5C7_POPAL